MNIKSKKNISIKGGSNLNTNRKLKKPTKKRTRTLKFFSLGIKRNELLEHLKTYNINPITIQTLSKIPRELFLPYDNMERSYENTPIPIGFNQTISQPSLICTMIDMLEIQSNHNILEIGTGFGYNACIMSLLCSNVVTMDIYKGLCKGAKNIISFLNKSNILRNNINIIYGNGYNGYIKNMPYDRIMATCGSIDTYPKKLGEQLKEGGILVIPIKKNLNGIQTEKVYKFKKINNIIEEDKTYKPIDVRFVLFENKQNLKISKKI